MLSNEKYMGDSLLQKTYTIDYLTKKRVKNNGIVPQYYVEDSHEAIISKQIFYKVQEEKAKRTEIYRGTNKKGTAGAVKHSSQFALTEILICAECGSHCRRATWARDGKKQIVWRCINRLEHGTRICKSSPTLKEESIEKTIMEAICSAIYGDSEATNENMRTKVRIYEEQSPQKSVDEQLQALQNQMLHYVELKLTKTDDSKVYDTKFEQISKEIASLQKQKNVLEEHQRLSANDKQQIDEIGKFPDSSNGKISYDNELVQRLIQSVRVVSKQKVIVQFKSGRVVNNRCEL